MKKKKIIVTILALSAMSCFAFATSNIYEATAQSTTFVVEETPEVRLTEPYGMRFKLKMSEAEYNNLTEETNEGVRYETGKSLKACVMPESIANSIVDNNWDNIPQQTIIEINPETIYLKDDAYYAEH